MFNPVTLITCIFDLCIDAIATALLFSAVWCIAHVAAGITAWLLSALAFVVITLSGYSVCRYLYRNNIPLRAAKALSRLFIHHQGVMS